GLIELGQRRRDDHGDRMTAVHAEAARANGRFQSELQRVMAALGGAAAVMRFGVFVTLMATGPPRGFDRFEVRPTLRVEKTGQPRHAVGPLLAEVQATAPGPILVAEQAVGIEVVGDAL